MKSGLLLIFRNPLMILLFILAYFHVFYFIPSLNFFPVNDSMQVFSNFYVFYNEIFMNREIPLWNPYTLFGLPNDFYLLSCIAPAQYFAALLGIVFDVRDALTLFKLSMVLEALTLLLGVFLLGQRLFKSRWTILFLGITSLATISWGMQVWWNFRLYYFTPLVFFFLIKFFDTRKLTHLWTAGILVIISLVGNLGYFIPIYFFLYALFSLILFFHKKTFLRNFSLKSIFQPSALLVLAGFGILAFVYLEISSHFFDNAQTYITHRNPDGTSSLDVFLSWGGLGNTGLGLLWQFLYAAPTSFDFTCYLGYLPLVFLLYGIFCCRNDIYFRTFTGSALGVVLISLSHLTLVAPLLYLFFPGMQYFRHVGYILPLAKVLLLIASGFGFEHFVQNGHLAPYRLRWISGAVLLLIFVFLLDVFFKGSYPYRAIFIDYQFHFIPFFILLVLVIIIFRMPAVGEGQLWIILGLHFFSLASYHFIFFHQMPAHTPSPNPSHFQYFEDYAAARKRVERAFQVRNHDFRLTRWTEEQMAKIRPEIPVLLDFFGFKHPDLFNALYIDPCHPKYRVDFLSLGMDRLLRARQRIQFDKPLVGGVPLDALMEDSAFLEAIGCNSPKIRLAANISTAATLSQASESIGSRPQIKFLGLKGGYGRETAGMDWWYWTSGDLEFRYRAMHPLKQIRMEFWYMPASNNRTLRIVTQSDQRRELKFKMNGGWNQYLSPPLEIGSPEFTINFLCDEPPVRISERDQRLASFLIKNLRIWGDSNEPQDINEIPVVLTNEAPAMGGATSGPARRATPGVFQIERFTANSIRILADIQAPSGAWLLYLDSHHPGWEARVNSQARPIAIANLAFKAIKLEPGRNEVLFRFTGNRAPGFFWFLFILGILWGALLLLVTVCFLFPRLSQRALKWVKTGEAEKY